MGTSRFSDDDWSGYVSKTASTPIDKIYTSKSLDTKLNPLNAVRESCDSSINPKSTPIIVAIDDTGSMGMLAETIIRKGLGVVMREIYERKPVSDPHLLLGAVGDAWHDKSPLQVTQFEAGTDVLIDQVTKFHIERGGGGNGWESYNLPWYFAANKTKCDNFIKRNQKGFLFTVGDEPPPPYLEKAHVKKIFGDDVQGNIPSRDLVTQAQKAWNVYHIIVQEGSGAYTSGDDKHGTRQWKELLGEENVIPLSDHKQLAEVIVSIMQVASGKSVDDVVDSWNGNTALVVRKSINGLSSTSKTTSAAVTRF